MALYPIATKPLQTSLAKSGLFPNWTEWTPVNGEAETEKCKVGMMREQKWSRKQSEEEGESGGGRWSKRGAKCALGRGADRRTEIREKKKATEFIANVHKRLCI